MTHRAVDPALPAPGVVFVLALEYQVTLSIELLSRPVEFSVDVRAVEDAAVLIRIHALAVQSIVSIETLQRAVEESCSDDPRW